MFWTKKHLFFGHTKKWHFSENSSVWVAPSVHKSLQLFPTEYTRATEFWKFKKKKLIPAESSFHQPDLLFCCHFFSYSWFAQGWSHSSYKDDFGTTATSKFSGITASCRIFVSGECHFLKNRKFIHVKTR